MDYFCIIVKKNNIFSNVQKRICMVFRFHFKYSLTFSDNLDFDKLEMMNANSFR